MRFLTIGVFSERTVNSDEFKNAYVLFFDIYLAVFIVGGHTGCAGATFKAVCNWGARAFGPCAFAQSTIFLDCQAVMSILPPTMKFCPYLHMPLFPRGGSYCIYDGIAFCAQLYWDMVISTRFFT